MPILNLKRRIFGVRVLTLKIVGKERDIASLLTIDYGLITAILKENILYHVSFGYKHLGKGPGWTLTLLEEERYPKWVIYSLNILMG